jgi:hypothetical protein
MAIQTIEIGGYANDGTGDDLRTAFEKVNSNFAELNGTIAIQTATTLGSPTGNEAGIFAQKNGSTLEFKKLTSTDGSVVLTPSSTAVNLHVVTDLSTDLTPQLGGNLDLNDHQILGVGNIGLIGTPADNTTTFNGYKMPEIASLLGMLFYAKYDDGRSIVNLDFGTAAEPTGWTGTQGQDSFNIDMGYVAGNIGHGGPSAITLDFGNA